MRPMAQSSLIPKLSSTPDERASVRWRRYDWSPNHHGTSSTSWRKSCEVPMITSDNWRKSSYSGEGDGNDCVEIATSPSHIAIRDSKAPARAPLTFPTGAFTTFLDALKAYST